jgi:hypothetical protein
MLMLGTDASGAFAVTSGTLMSGTFMFTSGTLISGAFTSGPDADAPENGQMLMLGTDADGASGTFGLASGTWVVTFGPVTFGALISGPDTSTALVASLGIPETFGAPDTWTDGKSAAMGSAAPKRFFKTLFGASGWLGNASPGRPEELPFFCGKEMFTDPGVTFASGAPAPGDELRLLLGSAFESVSSSSGDPPKRELNVEICQNANFEVSAGVIIVSKCSRIHCAFRHYILPL